MGGARVNSTDEGCTYSCLSRRRLPAAVVPHRLPKKAGREASPHGLLVPRAAPRPRPLPRDKRDELRANRPRALQRRVRKAVLRGPSRRGARPLKRLVHIEQRQVIALLGDKLAALDLRGDRLAAVKR